MYLVPTNLPIYVEGERQFIRSDWKRGLQLLRDSVARRYGGLVVAAPFFSAEDPRAAEERLSQVERGEEIELAPMYDGRMRAREFWLGELPQLQARMRSLIDRAQVLHTGLRDLRRPLMELPFVAALKRGLPTVFAQESGTLAETGEETPHVQRLERRQRPGYRWIYERTCRFCVAHADLALLEGKELMQRYGSHAKNGYQFHETSYLASEIMAGLEVERRLATIHDARPLRLLYRGGLSPRRGLDDAIQIVAQAQKLGADVHLDVIGQGPSEPALRTQIAASGLDATVRLLGARDHDAALIEELGRYDAMLFSPSVEYAPRSIFDGYAAGLPLLGVENGYVRERAAEEGATLLLPRGDVGAAARLLLALDRDRAALIPLTRSALRAARHHAADVWYERRAEWTHEAVARRRSDGPRPTRPPATSPRTIEAHGPV